LEKGQDLSDRGGGGKILELGGTPRELLISKGENKIKLRCIRSIVLIKLREGENHQIAANGRTF